MKSKYLSSNLKLLIKYGISTLSELSRATNIPKSTISTWCSGKSSPKFDSLNKISNYYHIDPQTLLNTELTMDDVITINSSNMYRDIPKHKANYNPPASSMQIESKLEKLEKLIEYLNNGFITKDEYEKLKEDVLKWK